MPHSTPFRKEQREGSAKWFLYEIKKNNREQNRPLHITHWAILVLLHRPWTWSRQNRRRRPSKQNPSPLPPHTPLSSSTNLMYQYANMQYHTNRACLFFSFHTYKVVLIKLFTFIETQALDFPSPVLKGPIGLPSRRMELLAVRRSTSLSKWIDRTALHCTQHTRLGFRKNIIVLKSPALLSSPPRPLAAWIENEVMYCTLQEKTGKRGAARLPITRDMIQLLS